MDESEFQARVLRALDSIQGRLTRLEDRIDDLGRVSTLRVVDPPHAPRSTEMQPCGCRWGQGTGRIICAKHAEDRNYPPIGEYDLSRDEPTGSVEIK